MTLLNIKKNIFFQLLSNLDAGKSARKHESANKEDGEEDVGHRGRDPDDFPRGLDAFKEWEVEAAVDYEDAEGQSEDGGPDVTDAITLLNLEYFTTVVTNGKLAIDSKWSIDRWN